MWAAPFSVRNSHLYLSKLARLPFAVYCLLCRPAEILQLTQIVGNLAKMLFKRLLQPGLAI